MYRASSFRDGSLGNAYRDGTLGRVPQLFQSRGMAGASRLSSVRDGSLGSAYRDGSLGEYFSSVNGLGADGGTITIGPNGVQVVSTDSTVKPPPFYKTQNGQIAIGIVGAIALFFAYKKYG